MSEKYYREINTNKDIIRFKLQLGSILLKLNEHDLNIKNNDKDIKSDYDICTSNGNNLRDIDRKIYTTNNKITKINRDIENINISIIKHKYSIENIWLYDINIVNDYTITSSKVTLFEYTFRDKFIVNSILEISCNILYKYDNHNDIGLLKHVYRLIDENDSAIYQNIIIHSNSGDNYTNYQTMNDAFAILFKNNNNTSKLKLNLSIDKVDINNTKRVKFRILNPYDNNTLRTKHIKFLLL